MYAFVDRAVDEQNRGVQFLVWSMRQWMKGAVERRCVCRAIGVAFETVGMDQAVDAFHLAMRTICNNAAAPLRFGAVDRPSITEHEAILLAAAAAAEEGQEPVVRAIADALVRAEAAGVLVASLSAVVSAFVDAGLRLNEPAHDIHRRG